jgi:hypothetical protein
MFVDEALVILHRQAQLVFKLLADGLARRFLCL